MDNNGAIELFNSRRQQDSRSSQQNARSRIRQEAVAEAVKTHTSKLLQDKQRFDNLVNRSAQALFEIKSVFPFDFFPNTLTVDIDKITVKFKQFFSSVEIRSINISNIAQVYVDSGPLFATMYVADQVIVDESSRMRIPYLRKDEAMKARRIIQGLIIAKKSEIDLNNIHDEDMIEKVEELGRM